MAQAANLLEMSTSVVKQCHVHLVGLLDVTVNKIHVFILQPDTNSISELCCDVDYLFITNGQNGGSTKNMMYTSDLP